MMKKQKILIIDIISSFDTKDILVEDYINIILVK